jgi:hypothetical protein
MAVFWAALMRRGFLELREAGDHERASAFLRDMALAVAKLAMERAGWREVRLAGERHTLLGVCDMGPCAHMGVHRSTALHCIVF